MDKECLLDPPEEASCASLEEGVDGSLNKAESR